MICRPLTLFAVPKAFRGHIATIQRNAIRSWTRLLPASHIFLVGDDPGTAEFAEELGIGHVADVERNEYGTPLLNSVFENVERVAFTECLAYVNADIILLPDFLKAFERIPWRRFLMVGRRWDLDITDELDFETSDWQAGLRASVRAQGKLQAESAIDYFVYRRGIWGKIPSFALGRTAWDNWLLYQARMRRVPLIDATDVVLAIHQNHDYSHAYRGDQGTWPGQAVWEGPEAKRNVEIGGGPKTFFTLLDATWKYRCGQLVPNNDPSQRARREQVWGILHPRLKAVRRLPLRACRFALRRLGSLGSR